MINACRPQVIECRLSFWFVMFSPLLGIMVGILAVFVFSN